MSFCDANASEEEESNDQVESQKSRAKKYRKLAKWRRETENSLLTELTDLIPLERGTLEKQDKSSLLRLVITYIRCRNAIDPDDDGIEETSEKKGTRSRGQQAASASVKLVPSRTGKDIRRQSDTMEMEDGPESPPSTEIAAWDHRHGCSLSIQNGEDLVSSNAGRLTSSCQSSSRGIVCEAVNGTDLQLLKGGDRSEQEEQRLKRSIEGLQQGMQESLLTTYSEGHRNYLLNSSHTSPAINKNINVAQCLSCADTGRNNVFRISHSFRNSRAISESDSVSQNRRSQASKSSYSGSKGALLRKYRPNFMSRKVLCESQLLLDAAQAFVLVIDKHWRILFVSENVSQHLGYHQAGMLGRSIQDYIHPSDFSKLVKQSVVEQCQPGNEKNPPSWKTRRMFYVGMKFCFQKPGSRYKIGGYTLVQWNMNIRVKQEGEHVEIKALVGLCKPVRTESLLEIRMEGNMFISRHDLSFHFTFCDPRIVNLIGYEPSDLIGRTAYQFHSPWDAVICRQCHKNLISEGWATSDFYRFLSRTGVWVWMVTQATIVYDTQHQPQYIVCRNHVISPEEAEKKLKKEMKDFESLKCLGFSLETDLPIVDPEASHQTLAHNQKTKDIELLEQILRSQLSDSQKDSNFPLRNKRNLTTVSDIGIGSINDPQNLQDVLQQSSFSINENHVSLSPKVSAMSEGVVFLPLVHKNNQPEVVNVPMQEDMTESVTNMFGISLTDSLDVDIEPSQVLHSDPMLPILTTTNMYYFTQENGLSNICGQNLMMDTLSDQLESPVDTLSFNEFHMSDETEDSGAFYSDHLPDKFALEGTNLESDVNKCIQNRDQNTPKSMDTSSDFSVPDFDSTFSAGSFPQDISFSSDYDDITPQTTSSNIQDSGVSKSPPKIMSSKLASLLQTGNSTSPPSSPCQKMGHTFDLLGVEAGTKSSTSGKIPYVSDHGYVTNIQKTTLCNSNDVTSDSPNPRRDSTLSRISKLEHQVFSSSKDSNIKNQKHSETDLSLLSGFYPQGKISTLHCKTMTNKKLDPFLSSPSHRDLSLLPDLNMTDGDLTPKTRSVKSSFQSTLTSTSVCSHPQNKQIFKDQIDPPHSVSDHSFMNTTTSSSMADAPCSISELDSFLQTIPSGPTTILESGDTQPIPLSGQPKFSAETSSTLLSKSADCHMSSSTSPIEAPDSEMSGRPSLLRTLLDEERAAIQGPLTYTEWILTQALKKNNEVTKTKTSNNLSNSKFSGSKRIRGSKSSVRKSTELPLPRCSHVGMKFVREGLQNRKPTKELPLPPSALTTSSLSLMLQKQEGLLRKGNSQESNSSNKEVRDSATALTQQEIQTEDYSLPDDLLDLAVEYCASFGAEQAEDLISDLNDSSSLEDNLYSLIGSPGQVRSNGSSSFQSSQQPGQSPTKTAPATELSSNCGDSKTSKFHSPSAFPNSSILLSKNNCKPGYGSAIPVSQTSLKKNPHSKQSLEPCTQGCKASGEGKLPLLNSAGSSNGKGRMSLLRAAVTSPDVDKLIEQIPLGNAKKYQPSSHSQPHHTLEEPDIIITKVTGLQKSSAVPSTPIPHGRVFKVPSTTCSVKQSGKTSPSKAVYSPTNPMNASDHMDAVLFDHFYTASLSQSSFCPSQLSPPPSVSPSGSPPNSRKHHSPQKINSSSDMLHKVHQTSRSSHGPNKQKSAPNSPRPNSNTSSPRPNPVSLCSPSSPRAGGITNTDLSSTQPVSVMIMRKENHRSRRSKNVAIQTDNEPGEVYPEFERNPTDTILYPSVMISSYPSTASPIQNTPPTLISSPPSMSELEKFLRGYPNTDDSSSSADEDSRSRSSMPFLQKLLTGELSKDHYQQLDQQLLARERKGSFSSGSDLE